MYFLYCSKQHSVSGKLSNCLTSNYTSTNNHYQYKNNDGIRILKNDIDPVLSCCVFRFRLIIQPHLLLRLCLYLLRQHTRVRSVVVFFKAQACAQFRCCLAWGCCSQVVTLHAVPGTQQIESAAAKSQSESCPLWPICNHREWAVDTAIQTL